MSRFRLVFALLLAAVWLPVTSHCRLEAAGVLESPDCCAMESAAAADGCKDDACPTVEDALYKESSQSLKIAAAAACACVAWLSPAPADAVIAEPALSPLRHAPPPELAVTWQFVARAAPPARAPSLNT